MTILLVALGAAIGAPARYLTDRAVQARLGTSFPWGTLTVNVAGSLFLGFILGVPLSHPWAALLGTGFCGALTTYSTFSWETLSLHRAGRGAAAAGNALISVLAGIGAASIGLLIARAVS